APFRIYYAYNLNRLHSQIVAPPPFIEPKDISNLEHAFDGIDPTIYPLQIRPQLESLMNNPGRLNYFEPKTTFRLMVGKSFDSAWQSVFRRAGWRKTTSTAIAVTLGRRVE